MKKNQKGLSLILAVIAVAIVVIVAMVFFLTQKGSLSTGIQPTSQNVPAIQDTDGLNNTASELDNTNLDEMDAELNRLDSDTSTF